MQNFISYFNSQSLFLEWWILEVVNKTWIFLFLLFIRLIYKHFLWAPSVEDTFCVSYSDDSYIALSCPPNETNFSLTNLQKFLPSICNGYKALEWSAMIPRQIL